MRRLTVSVLGMLLVLSGVGTARGVVITFPPSNDVPGTIKDNYGHGTGFTDRLPGSGGSLPANDPNLDLSANPGRLTIHSTPDYWPNPVHNPALAEAIGVLLPNPGTNDITIGVGLRNVHLNDWSDQLGLYVAPSGGGDVLRAALHMELQYQYGPSGLRQYLFTDDSNQYFVTPAPYPPIGTPGIWDNGDDIDLTLSRTGSLWKMLWNDLTNASQGESPSWTVSGLDNQDLYVGIYYVNPRNPFSSTSEIEYFSAVPEPSTLVLLGVGAIGLLGYAWRRRR
jgi:hypothetical protein